MRSSIKSTIIGLIAFLLLICTNAIAQVDIGPLPDQYRNAAVAAWPVIEPYARRLFWLLAAIQLAWAAIMLALEKSDLQGWVVGLVRQIFFIGLGAAILLNAQTWMFAIFDSFLDLGRAVNSTALQPGDIFGRGIDMTGQLLRNMSIWSPGVAIAIALAAAVVAIAFSILAVSLLLALIEGAIAVVLGQILLGFAGSKWTIGYTEKYFGMIVNVGLKVFTTYFMAGVAMTITQNWVSIAASTTTADKIYELMGGSIILAVVVWAVPRFVSMVIGGAPSLGFSDAAGVVAGMATAVGTVAGGAIAGGMKAGSAASGALRGNAITGTTSPSGGYSGADGATVMPPTSPSGGGSGGGYGGPSPGYGAGAARSAYGTGSGGGSALSSAGERPTQSADQKPPSREDSGDGTGNGSGSRGEGMGSRIGGQNDLISSAAQGVAAQAGMSRFVPSSVGSASTRGTGTAAPDSGSPAGGVMPPVIPGSGMAGGAAVSPPMGNPTIGGEALGSRGGVDVAGNAPQGVGGTSMDLGGGSPAGITTSAPMTTGGASGTPGLTPGTSGGGLASPAPMQGTGEQTGMSAAATMVSAGAIIGSGGSSPPTSPPPPPPAPEQRQESLPGIKDDYERMDQANRRNKLTLDRPRHPDQPGLRGPSRPKP